MRNRKIEVKQRGRKTQLFAPSGLPFLAALRETQTYRGGPLKLTSETFKLRFHAKAPRKEDQKAQTARVLSMSATLPLLLSMVALLAFATAGAEAGQKSNAAPRAALLEIGEFHGEEVKARSGEKWLGLHVSAGGSLLLPYRIKVEAVHDPIVDENEAHKTGKAVTVDLPLQPLFLVKGATELKEGPVITVADDERTLEKVSPLSLTVADHSYTLKVVGDKSTEKCSDQTLPENAKLVLVSGDSSQVLYSLAECGDDAGWRLLWAGDLDGDGKLDLYINVTQHYNVSEKRLFLSSRAAQGQLVKEVAEFVTTGC